LPAAALDELSLQMARYMIVRGPGKAGFAAATGHFSAASGYLILADPQWSPFGPHDRTAVDAYDPFADQRPPSTPTRDRIGWAHSQRQTSAILQPGRTGCTSYRRRRTS
jgi:hypothetical protein